MSLDLPDNIFQPLAARMWPESLAQHIDQQHLLATGESLPRAVEAGHLHSIILWGPPDAGKTIPAEVIACYASADAERISTAAFSVKGVRETIERAQQDRNASRRTVLFVDEVYRFNKSQRDAPPSHIEDGTITFIGATTENPLFGLNSALLSRTRVYLLKSLNTEDIEQVLTQAVEDKTRDYGGQGIALLDGTRRTIAELVNDDVRRALNTLEMTTDMAEVDDSGKRVLKPESPTEVVGEHSARFDDRGDRFYGLISALHKSIRGSAPDATLYWYARIITAGGDPLYVTHRCLAIVSEDADNADPRTIQATIATWDCFARVGPVEDECVIAQVIVYLVYAPKSDVVYTALKAALADARKLPDYDVPVHLRSTSMKLMKRMGYGQEHYYVRDEANAYATGEAYFPPEIAQTRHHSPTNRGLEGKVSGKFAWLAEQDQDSPMKCYR